MTTSTVERESENKHGEYSVRGFSSEALIELLSKHSGAGLEHVRRKRQTDYLIEHLKGLDVKNIIVETKYFCRHYLADFSLTYCGAFFDYKRHCVRLHFLDESYDFGEAELETYLKGQASPEDIEAFQDAYLGFCVVRPLEHAVIGRTCIRPVKIENVEPDFSLEREYYANIFGNKFSVNTVAFQEQDQAGAACATAALWSLFTVTGRLYHHRIPAPAEITRAAIKNVIGETRTHDTPGLNLEQMIQAIRDVGLEAIAFKTNLTTTRERAIFKAYVRAFIKGGIPLIFNCSLYENWESEANKGNFKGNHAVAVTGCVYDPEEPCETEFERNPEFMLKSNCINQIRVHDDQVGGFAEMKPVGNRMSTRWREKKSKSVVENVSAIPYALLVPLPALVRNSIREILLYASNLDLFIRKDKFKEALDKANPKDADILLLLSKGLIWDITLVEGRIFKNKIANTENMLPAIKKALLQETVPCFIWRAVGSVTKVEKGIPVEKEVVEIAVDATDFGQRHDYPKIIPYNTKFVSVLVKFVCNPEIKKTLSRMDDFHGIIKALEEAEKLPL